MPPWSSAKAKVQLRYRSLSEALSLLSVQRLRTLQEKKEAQAKASRRDIAVLIERGKLETARIKTENIINEDIYVELLELLELYCELLLARFGLLEQSTREPDPGIKEGVYSIVHAAPRTELKELHILRELLMQKYGREFAVACMENTDNCVSERIMRKMAVATPSTELVDAYLTEIAKGYGIKWAPAVTTSNSGEDDDVGGGLGVKEANAEPEKPTIDDVAPAAVGSQTTGITILPSVQGKTKREGEMKLPDLPPTESTPPPEKPEVLDDFDALTKRFDALKKR